MCSDQFKDSLMVIPRYLADETCFMVALSMLQIYDIEVRLIVMQRNSHLLKLKRSCQSLDHLITLFISF